MSIKAELPPLVRGLLEPRAYPHPTGKIELVQTQMSFLFLTGEYTYKVKKPVNLGYLDYTTLAKRLHFCQQEVELNRRLCPETYLSVLPVTQDERGFTIGGKGEAVEYVVQMRQLPQDRMLDNLLRQGKVTAEMMRRVADKLAAFHLQAESNEEISRYGDISAIRTNTEENFSQTEKSIGRSLTEQQYRALQEYTHRFLQQNTSLLEERKVQGRIKDCHGDLHSAHICFTDGICIYDCIEFNDRFRYGDVASEVAFLAMDVDSHRQPELSQSFIAAYREKSGDKLPGKLLNFYKVYRAYVRGKVESFKLDDPLIPEKEKVLATARRYFDLAYSYSQPRLFITAGMVGTGKTALAEALAKEMALAVLSSDVIRKTLAQIPTTEHHYEEFEGGIYAQEFSQKTYDELMRQAKRFLEEGQSVIIDASFQKRRERLRAKEMATEVGADFWIIECQLAEEMARQRLEKRLTERGVVSDGRWEVYQWQKKTFEPVQETSPAKYIPVDTSQPLAQAVERVIKRLNIQKGSVNG